MTPNDDAYRLLSEYAAGNLNDNERGELARAALTDPEIFEALAEEETLREALEDTVFRRQVKERLRELGAESDPFWTRLLQYLLTPKGMVTTAGALATVTFAILVQTGVFRPTPPLVQLNFGPLSGQASSAASIMSESGPSEETLQKDVQSLPAPLESSAMLQLDRGGKTPVYQIGDRQRIGFKLQNGGNAILWEDLGNGTSYRLFPNRLQSSLAVEAGQTIVVPPLGQGNLEVQGPPGERVLRLVIFPENVDPLDGRPWASLRVQSKEVQLRYQVKEK